MKSNVLRRKYLKSCFRSLRQTRSLLRKSRSPIFRRKFAEIVKIINNCLKISQSYECDLSLLKDNNVNLARAVQNEKEHSKNLLQDKILAESTYHDLLKEHICLKKELQNHEKVILSYDAELRNSMIPNLVKLSDDITKFKFKNDITKKAIENRRNGDVALPKNSWSNGVNFGTNGNQPISAVNPMIKGCVIQKPTINVRRVSIPYENRTSLFANVGISSPILEEPEDQLETVSSRSRKCKNGLRHVINLSNATVGSSVQSISAPEIEFGNRTEEVNDINLRMEPVVRLSDVTRMLQNSSYRISEPVPETPVLEKHYSSPINHQFTPEILLKRCKTPKPIVHENQSVDNPLEGCSWMFQDKTANHFECTPPISSAQREDWNKTHISGISQEKASRISTVKINSSVEVHGSTDKRESFFREPSQLNNDLIINVNKRESSHQLRVSNTFLNESSSGVKENTFCSSTLNNSTLLKSSKKKFFLGIDVPSDLLTNHRRFLKSVPNADLQCADDAPCLSSPNLENDCDSNMDINPLLLQNCTSRPKRKSISSKSDKKKEADCSLLSCSSNLQTEIETSASSMTIEEELKKSRSKKSNRQTWKRNTDRRSFYSIDDSSSDEPLSRKKLKWSETFSTELTDNNSSKLKLTSRTRSSKVREKRPSVTTDSELANDSNVTSSESTLCADETSRPIRSSRQKSNISYKEPRLGTKLRRS